MGRLDSGPKSGVSGGVPRGRGMLVDIFLWQVWVCYTREALSFLRAEGIAVFRWPVSSKDSVLARSNLWPVSC